MLYFGLTIPLLGAILPSLIAAFSLGNAEAGALFTWLTLGMLGGSLVFGPFADRFGYRGLLLAGGLLLCAGVEMIALAGSIAVVRLALVLVGFGGGLMNGGTSALTADLSPDGRGAGLSLLGVFFGLGAFGGPLTMGLLLDRFPYTSLVGMMGLVAIVPIAVILVAPLPQAKQARGLTRGMILPLLRNPLLLTMGGLLFLQSGMEMTAGGWSAAYSSEVLDLPDGAAMVFLSTFWLGMLCSRFALGTVLRRFTPASNLIALMGLSVIGSTALLMTGSVALSALALFLLGAGLAAGYPVLLGFVGDLFPTLSGTAFGIAMVMALPGGSVAPYVTGLIGDLWGLRLSLLTVPLFLLLQAAVLRRALLRMRSHPADPNSRARTASSGAHP